MAKSPFFARIKSDVLAIAAAIPRGRLVTFTDIGHHLDVVPRHVAYILSQIKGDDQASTPWFRVVADNGILSTPKANAFGISQKGLLEEEGHIIAPDGLILELGQKLINVSAINSGVPKQSRPADAPKR